MGGGVQVERRGEKKREEKRNSEQGGKNVCEFAHMYIEDTYTGLLFVTTEIGEFRLQTKHGYMFHTHTYHILNCPNQGLTHTALVVGLSVTKICQLIDYLQEKEYRKVTLTHSPSTSPLSSPSLSLSLSLSLSPSVASSGGCTLVQLHPVTWSVHPYQAYLTHVERTARCAGLCGNHAAYSTVISRGTAPNRRFLQSQQYDRRPTEHKGSSSSRTITQLR